MSTCNIVSHVYESTCNIVAHVYESTCNIVSHVNLSCQISRIWQLLDTTQERNFSFFGIFIYTLLLILIFHYSYKLPDDNICININTYKFIQ